MSRGKASKTIRLENQIIEVLNDPGIGTLPVTVRRVYYRLVKSLFIKNNIGQYRRVVRVLRLLRESHKVPWNVIVDRSRSLVGKRGHADVEAYVKAQCEFLFKRYTRCLVQQERNYVELWTEKDALSYEFEEVAWPYCVRLVVCRGQLSATFLNDYAERAEAALERGKHPVILYGGDMDPSGIAIPRSIGNKLEHLYELPVTIDRFTLTPEQVNHYQLPVDPDAFKEDDPNAKRYIAEYGTECVELDALDAGDLKDLIHKGLARHLDVKAMQAEQKIEKAETEVLKTLRRDVMGVVRAHGYKV